MTQQIRDSIYTDIQGQFPNIYREEGEIFVSFVEEYYKFLESSLSSNELTRNFFMMRDIDTTYSKFLIFFKKKFLADLPLENVVDTRFIVKHILDLYQRKGSEESLRLLFKLFFDEEIEVFYPSTAILKASSSKYGFDRYLEMKPVKTFRDYPLRKGDRIKGSSSKATAFIDEVLFFNFSGVITPILYLSNVYGSFVSSDTFEVNRNGTIFYTSRLIRGSISSININTSNRIPGNNIGDILTIRSNENGIEGTCIVTKVSETITGTIDFVLEDGGYGYSYTIAENDVYISNQTLVLETDGILNLEKLDIVYTTNTTPTDVTSNTAAANTDPISGSGIVVSYEHPLLFLQVANTTQAFEELPSGTKLEVFVESGNSAFAISISEYNDSASFEIVTITNTETISIITDVIGDFLSVQIDSSDYGMSGSGAETSNTALEDAFTPTSYTIGEIESINILDSGIDHVSDVRSYISFDTIRNLDKRDYKIQFENLDINLVLNEQITQQVEVDLFGANTVNYTAKAEFLRRDGDDYYFQQKSYFDIEEAPVTIRNVDYAIKSIQRDELSLRAGENADVSGIADFSTGQVETVLVVNSGFRYRTGETVDLLNANGSVVATADIVNRGMGKTEGSWSTKTSFLNEPTKFIHDNFYYQEYSYDIGSVVSSTEYESLVKDIVGVAGTKLFSTSLINSLSTLNLDSDAEIDVYDLLTVPFITEANSGGDVIVTGANTETGDLLSAIVMSLDYSVSLE